jgi:hypothetical protein
MATVLEVYTTEKQRSLMRFLWAKEFSAKDIHKKVSVYVGKYLSPQKVDNWIEKCSPWWQTFR